MKESSTIKNIIWEDGTLYVEFKSGASYQYADVPVQTYRDFLEAESLGKFFSATIKNNYDMLRLHLDEPDPLEEFAFPTGPKPEGASTDGMRGDEQLQDVLEWSEEDEQLFLDIIDGDADRDTK